jgi:hypothetical protein
MPTGVPIRPDQLREMAKYRRRGWSNARIGEHMGLAENHVSHALARLHRKAMARLERDTAAILARQYQQLEWVAEESSDAWERSKLPAEAEKTTEEAIGGGGEGPRTAAVLVRTERTRKGQGGDPRFLERFVGALEQQRKVLGLDKPASATAVSVTASITPEVADAMLRAALAAKGGDHGPDH